MPYGDLTASEQAHWNEYTNLRRISDWPGFDKAQQQRKADARAWLVHQRGEIERAAGHGGDGKGWNANERRARFDFLSDDNLNSGGPRHEVRLPAPGSSTATEKVYLEEREVYLAFASTTDEQKARKQANADWLVARRKQLWRLMLDDLGGNEDNGRQDRYDALCIATHYGPAYEKWVKAHNKWGVPISREADGKGRAFVAKHAASFLGVSEKPAGSNRGPAIDDWEQRVFGSSGVPWCACFATCMCQDAGVKGAGSAGVSVIVDMARKGQGMFRGYTTDPARARTGDLAIIGSVSSHIGVVVDPPYGTVEGNTSPGTEGSQFNGGCVARKERKGGIVGWALVRWPDQ